MQPGTGEVYTAEHGPSNNDEVNRIEAGANYGWDPSQGGTVGGYDESVPMTDRDRFPDAVPAIWQSGRTTQAVCAAEFLEGEGWGGLEGALVVTALKGAKLLILTLEDDGSLAEVSVPEETDGPYGRLRGRRGWARTGRSTSRRPTARTTSSCASPPHLTAAPVRRSTSPRHADLSAGSVSVSRDLDVAEAGACG